MFIGYLTLKYVYIKIEKNVRTKLIIKMSYSHMTEEELNNFQLLLKAIKNNDLKMIASIVVDKDIDINYNDYYDLYYGTPLHYATKQKCKQKTLRLMLYAGANVNAKDYYGETPLHEAIRDNDKKMVKFLVETGADIYQKNNQQESPLELSTSKRALYNILIPYTKGHQKWIKIKPFLYVIGKITR